jgi:hypothetical protein
LATLACRLSAGGSCTAQDPSEISVWRIEQDSAAASPIVILGPNDFRGLTPARIALSPDGRRLVIAFAPGAQKPAGDGAGTADLLIVPVDAPASRTWIDSALTQIREIAFSDDGRYFAAGGSPPEHTLEAGPPHQVQVWAVGRSGFERVPRSPFVLSPLANQVSELAFAATARGRTILLAGGEYGTIDRWDVVSGSALGALRADSRAIYQLAFSRESGLVAAADSQNVVRLWDTLGWTVLQLTPDDDRIEAPGWLEFGGGGSWLVHGAGTLQLWDLDVGSMKRRVCALLRVPGVHHGADTTTPLWGHDSVCAAE